MASLPPSTCCGQISFHEGKVLGTEKKVYGLDAYVIGESSDTVVVIAPDIFGYQLTNTQLLADQIHQKTGAAVFVPDYFWGEGLGEANLSEEAINAWVGKHMPDKVVPLFNGFVEKLVADLHPKFLVGSGYCYGAKMVISNLAENGPLDVGCVAHPTFVEVGEVDKVAKPLLICAAQHDSRFTPELRQKTEEVLNKNGAVYEIDLFAKVSHGFAVRGDFSDPFVVYAANKALADQVAWIKNFTK